jgi:hypothetical protein
MKHHISGRRPAQSAKIKVITRAIVSEENRGDILGVTATEHHSMVELGDTISVLFFHNSSLDCAGTVTIWHNKNFAALKTYTTSLCGEWHDSLKLVVSELRDEGWTMEGELVTGSLAMDINGTQGIYSCGEFYRNREVGAAGN